MDDLISRDGAMDAVRNYPDDLISQLTAIEDLPSAQPERKKGKWRRRIIDSGYNADWICSECGYRVKTDFVNYNYCPNCGADMRGEEHG